jgi:hypothetical protein
MKYFLSVVCLAWCFAGCGTLTLTPGDFSWPVENVLQVDTAGVVQNQRYSFTVSVKPLLHAEGVEASSLRIICNTKGYYFVTAANFKNVYVFTQTAGELKLKKKVGVSEKGLDSPVLNQRGTFIQLVSGAGAPIILTEDGIQQGEKK